MKSVLIVLLLKFISTLFQVKKRACVGVSKGGKTTKIHLTTDKFGRPIIINLSAGNINDSLLFEKQIEGFNITNVGYVGKVIFN